MILVVELKISAFRIWLVLTRVFLIFLIDGNFSRLNSSARSKQSFNNYW